MRTAVLLGCVALSALALLPVRAPVARAETPCAVGDTAPDFTLKDQDGSDLRLSSFRGKSNVLVAFYPKDFTSGCTTEMKCLGREHDDIVRRGVTVLAISADSVKSHADFARTLGVRFRMLADEELAVAQAYGVLVQTPERRFAARSAFLVDREGVLRFVDRNFAVPQTLVGTPLLAAVDALAAPADDPLASLAELPEPERSGKTALGRFFLAVLAEDTRAIDALLHRAFRAKAGETDAAVRARRKEFLDAWRTTFEERDLKGLRLADVLPFDAVKVAPREKDGAPGVARCGQAVRDLAAAAQEGDLVVAVRGPGVTAPDGTEILAKETAVALRKDGETWRIVGLCGR